MQSKLAPVALFTYRRLDHTRRTVESLAANKIAKDTDLIIFSDGPKLAEAVRNVVVVQEYLATIQGFKSVSIVMREKNLGLANSIIGGVTEVLKRHDRVIVLEDDMVTSPYFLRYMNESLDYYESDDRVVSIHGYVFPVKGELPETFFLRGADCWGWATWKRGWDIFDCNGEKLLSELMERDLCRQFDFNGTYPYIEMLKDQIAGKNDSWAIRWYASAFLADKLTLYPGKSLVNNIGNDDSGVHCGKSNRLDVDVTQHPIIINNIDLIESAYAYRKIRQFLRRNIVVRMLSRIKRVIGHI